MKQSIHCILCLVAAGLIGCAGLSGVLTNYAADNPGVQTVALDTDEDGVADTVVIANEDGTIYLDPATSQPVEVPGARAVFDASKQTDADFSELLGTVGAVFGVGGVGLAGRWWARIKPTQRAVQADAMFRGLVASVQQIRHNPKLTPDTLTKINAILAAANSQIEGLDRAVALAKADAKAAADPPAGV